MTIEEATQIAVYVLNRQVILAGKLRRPELNSLIISYEEAIKVLSETHPPMTLGINVIDNIQIEDYFGC